MNEDPVVEDLPKGKSKLDRWLEAKAELEKLKPENFRANHAGGHDFGVFIAELDSWNSQPVVFVNGDRIRLSPADAIALADWIYANLKEAP